MIRVMSMISLMFRKRMKILSVVCAVFFSCYFGLILPLHHHADGSVHEECAMCAIQSQPADVAIIFCLIIIAVALSSTVPTQKSSFTRINTPVYLTRAPPVTA
jgi:hypothetical protein